MILSYWNHNQLRTYVYSVLQCFNPTHHGGQEFNQSVTELKPQISAVQVEGKQLKESCSTQVNYVHYTSVLSIVILYIAVSVSLWIFGRFTQNRKKALYNHIV